MSNKRIYNEQNEMGRLQENTRFAMQILIDDIRMAGYAGCSDDMSAIVNGVIGLNAPAQLMSFINAIEGVDSADSATPTNSLWQPSAATDQVVNMVDGTDAITVRYLKPLDTNINAPMGNEANNISVDNAGDLEAGDIVAVTDCNSADIVQLTTVAGTTLSHVTGAEVPGNLSTNLSKNYDENAEIAAVIARRYFIADKDPSPANLLPALFRLENQDTVAIELIEGVENMQIVYGEDTVGNDFIADTYVNAAAVTNWQNVVSVRIALLFRTETEPASNTLNDKTYTLVDVPNFDPTPGMGNDDRRRRRVVTNTIQVRNRTN